MNCLLPDRIHIFGASGSGTTTLAAAMCERLGYTHLDVDEFFWEPTDPPYREVRPVLARQAMLQKRLDESQRWVLSGSLCGWGDLFIERFECIRIEGDMNTDERLKRLLEMSS